jgi:alcohol dehydrogenase
LENNHNLIMPQTNLIGVGAIKDLPNELMDWKLSKALIVTDKNMITMGYVENVEKILKSLFISYDIFDGILHPNPTVSFVEDGLAYIDSVLNAFKRDYKFIISIGGGTNHDCAKAIAAVVTNGGSITDYEGYNKVTKPMLPVIAINTTGGSGAEMTNIAVITDDTRKVKMVIMSPKLIPTITVNDPMFMSTAPKEVTASSGIDVLTQGIEAYVSTEASPITDVWALGAIKLGIQYLPRAYENGYDMEAREKMMYANIMAGMALNNAGLGLVHSLAHQLGGFYNKTHGYCNAVLLPHILDFNAVSIPEERILKIAEAMSINANNKSQALDKIITSLRKLSNDIAIPSGLKQMGVGEKDIEQLSRNALKDITAYVNPRQATLEDIMNLYKAAM